MNYPQARHYLASLTNYETIPSYNYKECLNLERIGGFLKEIGDPQNSLRCIHIAGSKGKGSTCAFIAHILCEAGYNVGLYTSPHLKDFRERIRILSSRLQAPSTKQDFEGMISRSDMARLMCRLIPKIRKYNRACVYGPLTYFEAVTALAFEYFKEKKTDFCVLETGLGGRLDATSAADALVCALTPISYEHTDKLGKSLRKIAWEKAGIIKGYWDIGILGYWGIVVSAPQEKEAREVIRKKCRSVGAKLIEVKNGVKIPGLSLLGAHQSINAAVALKVIDALKRHGIKIPLKAVRKGLKNTSWPCRCEVISRSPMVVLDGAQNEASAAAIRKALKDNFHYKDLILVLGISSDKDTRGICRQLSGLAKTVILTKSKNPRALSPEVLATFFPGKTTYVTHTVAEAKRLARKLAGKKDLILVTGSLFVAGEYRQ